MPTTDLRLSEHLLVKPTTRASRVSLMVCYLAYFVDSSPIPHLSNISGSLPSVCLPRCRVWSLDIEKLHQPLHLPNLCDSQAAELLRICPLP